MSASPSRAIREAGFFVHGGSSATAAGAPDGAGYSYGTEQRDGREAAEQDQGGDRAGSHGKSGDAHSAN